MNRSPLFSLIVPFYNEEKYLKNCLDSVLEQDFSDYEVIMVDDRSRDSSLKIVESYLTDARFHLLKNREKSGVSDTRNTGIENASGEYVLFLDGDDCLVNGALSKLAGIINIRKMDAVVYRKVQRISGELKEEIQSSNLLRCVEKSGVHPFISERLRSGNRNLFCSNTVLFKKEKIRGLRFEDINGFDGWLFTLKYLFGAESLFEYSEILYIQNVHLHSLSVNYYVPMLNESVLAYDSIRNFLKENSLEDYLKEIADYFLNHEILKGTAITGAIENEYTKNSDTDRAIENVRAFLSGKEFKTLLEDGLKFNLLSGWLAESCLEEDEEYIRKIIFRKTAEKEEKNLYSIGRISPREYCINEEKRIIYLVNSKVACSSLKDALSSYDYEDDYSVHFLTRESDNRIKHELNEEEKKYYCFSFVREPYHRLISVYEGKIKEDHKKGYNYYTTYLDGLLSRDEGFEMFIKKICSIPLEKDDRHFTSQYCLLFDESGEPIPDYIGKLENIEEDFEPIRMKYGLKKLRRLNESTHEKKDWREYYNEETAMLVYEKYKKDFEIFGYENVHRELIEYLQKR